jgi:outer membrane protein insertion porin family
MDKTVYPGARRSYLVRLAANRGSRYLFFCCILLLLFNGISLYGEQASGEQLSGLRIGSIETAGNRNVERSEILAKLRSRVGDTFNPQTADEDAKRITELPGIQRGWYNKSIVDGQVRLIFVVVERNVVRSIKFTGNENCKSETLRKKLDFKKADFLDPVMAEAGRGKILEHYHNKGFAFATVGLDMQELSKGNVVYIINEGNRVKIASVNYTGNKQISLKELKKVSKLKEKKFTFWPIYYIKEHIDKAVTNLQNAYYKRGFLNVSINVEENFNADKSEVELTCIINEGAAYTVDKITLTGNKQFDDEQLLSELKMQQGDVFNKLKGDSGVRQMNKLYREGGFIDATVEQDVKFVAEDKIDARFIINEGRRFRIGEIDITGNEQIQDRVIRRILDEYDFTPGNFYNADIARGDGKGYLEKMIRTTAYTESATIMPVESPKPDEKDALVTIVEGKTGMVMAGAGVSADMGAIGQLIYDERNFDITNKPKSLREFITGKGFRGAGQRLRIALEPGTEVSSYSISFTEPYLKDKPISLDLAGSSWERAQEAYDEERLKGFLGFEKRYKNRWRRSLSFRYENVDITSIDWDAPKEIRDIKGGNLITAIRIGTSRDLTDDQFNPTTGYIFDIGYEQAAGDYTFGKLSGFYQKFRTIREDLAERKTILATKLYGATIVGNAPAFEKFYAGGSGTYYGIRGFDYRGVSTRGVPTTADGLPIAGRKKEDPIGSEWIVLANAELIVPLVGDNFSALFFVDSGMIDTGGPRASVGTGIQILIPQWFGPVPMRFELATPLLKDGEDETQVFSFSIGRLF